MTEVELTSVFSARLMLTEDRLGSWTLEDASANEFFIQSDYDREAWAEERLIINYVEWMMLSDYLKDRTLIPDIAYEVRASPDDWGLAVCES